MMRRLLALAATLATSLGFSGAAWAQAQVYDPVPPRGSAYVRLVNVLPGEVTARPDFLPQQRLGTAPAQRVMAFTTVENVANRQLRLEFQEGQRRGQASFRVEPGSFVTVLLHATANGGLAATPVVDSADFNRARARLAFYNAMPDCPAAGVTIQPSGPAVFEGVPSLGTRARSVNPVTAEIRSACGDRASAPFALEGLEAGGMYSIWLISGTPQPQAFVTRDTTAVWRP
ncbi:alginate O-acetyltransferase AlgF [Roseococcus sp. SDR]|uniref:ABC transporter permease n=1 Tax=Roseococcus sp. SDR TaxID=2835532 RepID=UPI001BD027AC|nr:ABC transporter permease [Roseococcus sp. SDR]MBS7792418.1 ABC transporter permease [Roseococcus sp. SDR]MBV1847732.1 alginate O-acetyltransferase AlgF [Roseococcus sp. SDR]